MSGEEFIPFGAQRPTLVEDTHGLLGDDGLLTGRYRILSKLGKGGMGEVFLGEHAAIQKQVAIKILLEERARQEVQKQRFLTEARATARIRHPNVIDISDFGETPDGRAFFVMEYLDGEDLKRLLRRKHVLPWREAAPILLQMCSGLAAAHEQSIIHRDLKPDNVYLINHQGTPNFVKILDFGLAKLLNDPTAKKLTKTGIIVGTPAFIAPEQIKGDAIDHRADIYALGLILYRMLCGRLPFRAKTVVEMLRKHMKEVPQRPSELAPDAPIATAAEDIALRCLQKEPAERFGTMVELAEAIASVAPPAETAPRPRQPGQPLDPATLAQKSGPISVSQSVTQANSETCEGAGQGSAPSAPAAAPELGTAKTQLAPIVPGSSAPQRLSSKLTSPMLLEAKKPSVASTAKKKPAGDTSAQFRSQLLSDPDEADASLRHPQEDQPSSVPMVVGVILLMIVVTACAALFWLS